VDSSAATAEPAPASTYTPPLDVFELLGDGLDSFVADPELCKNASEVIDGDGALSRAKSRLDELSNVTTAWDSYDYVQNNSWVTSAAAFSPGTELDYLAEGILRSLVSESTWEYSDEFEAQSPSQFKSIASGLRGQILNQCDLQESADQSIRLHTRAVGLLASANNRPWYPKDYNVYPANSSIAYKWADRRCSYSSGSCTHMDVVAKLGCSNLYVEVTFLDSSGAYVDWSNDTARALTANQVAKLEFVTFNNAARRTQIAEVSCY